MPDLLPRISQDPAKTGHHESSSSRSRAAAPVVVLWRRFKDGLASICVLIRSCKMPKESETTGLNGRKWWLVGNTMIVDISDKVVLANVQDSSWAPLVHCINSLHIRLINWE